MEETKNSDNPSPEETPDTFKQHYAGTFVAKRYHAYNDPITQTQKANNPEGEPLPMEVKRCVAFIRRNHSAITAVFTIGIFAVTAIYATVALLQWCAMLNQGRIMSGQLVEAKREQRPWIGVIDQRIVQFGPEKDYTVEIEMTDSGKDPALKAWYWDKSTIDPKSGPAANNMDDGKKHVYIGSIPPQGHRKMTLNWKWDEWKSRYRFVANHVSSISNYGEIVYHDSDGEERRTQFCIYMKDAGLPSQRLTFCDQWNEMN